jgi:hypothetical protein
MPHRGRQNADEMLLMALACGATVEAAAQKAGVSRGTANRRLNDPDFRQRLQEVRSEMVQRTAGMLTAAAGEAVKTLLDLQKNTVPHASRLGAARSVLEIGIKMRESADLEARLAAVEAQLAAPNPSGGDAGPQATSTGDAL